MPGRDRKSAVKVQPAAHKPPRGVPGKQPPSRHTRVNLVRLARGFRLRASDFGLRARPDARKVPSSDLKPAACSPQAAAWSPGHTATFEAYSSESGTSCQRLQASGFRLRVESST